MQTSEPASAALSQIVRDIEYDWSPLDLLSSQDLKLFVMAGLNPNLLSTGCRLVKLALMEQLQESGGDTQLRRERGDMSHLYQG